MRKLIRLDSVLDRTGESRSGLYRKMAAGLFPRPIVVSGTSARRWIEDEVDAWVDQTISLSPRVGGPEPTENN